MLFLFWHFEKFCLVTSNQKLSPEPQRKGHTRFLVDRERAFVCLFGPSGCACIFLQGNAAPVSFPTHRLPRSEFSICSTNSTLNRIIEQAAGFWRDLENRGVFKGGTRLRKHKGTTRDRRKFLWWFPTLSGGGCQLSLFVPTPVESFTAGITGSDNASPPLLLSNGCVPPCYFSIFLHNP